MTSKPNRRQFIGAGAALPLWATTGLALGTSQDKAPPSDRLGLGFIGVGGMGKGTLKGILEQPDVDVRGICDVYQPHLDAALKLTNGKAKGYKDFRQLLEDKAVDAVVVSTPDHWHALASIRALEAGKHVYCEKPLSHTIAEGRAMVEAARKHNRITQMGIQIHAEENYHKVVDIVRSGALGKIHKARVWISKDHRGLGNPANSSPPNGLDWNLWLGPASWHDFNKNRFIFNWRWFWDYGGGNQTDMGCHIIDLVHWALEATAPTSITASGGRLLLNDNTETPDTMEVVYEYPSSPVAKDGFVMTYSNTLVSQGGPENKSLGIIFEGTRGRLVADYRSFQMFNERGRRMRPPEIKNPIARSPGHHRDWLDGIKASRLCTADFEYGHRLATVCTLGNLALLLNRKLHWNGEEEKFIGDDEANAQLTKEYRKFD